MCTPMRIPMDLQNPNALWCSESCKWPEAPSAPLTPRALQRKFILDMSRVNPYPGPYPGSKGNNREIYMDNIWIFWILMKLHNLFKIWKENWIWGCRIDSRS